MTTGNDLPIVRYGSFFDFPRGMYVQVGLVIVRLNAEFDDVTDDFREYYDVWIMPDADPSSFPAATAAIVGYTEVPIGTIAVSEIEFDPSRRKTIKCNRLEEMVAAFVMTC